MALSDYAKYKKLTIDSSKIDSDLSHFPVAIPLGTAVGLTDVDVTDIFTEVGADYLKIAVFMADESTQLYVEVEQWDATNNKGLLWVSRDTWSVISASDTEIYLAFYSAAADNTAYVGTPSNRPEVWHSGLKGFWGLAQDPDGGVGSLIDSTGNGNHGDPGGGLSSADLVGGHPAGQSLDFDSGEYVRLPDIDWQISAAFTLKATIKTTIGIIGQIICDDRSASGERTYHFRVESDGSLRLIRFGGGTDIQISGSTVVNDGNYHRVVAKFTNTAGSKLFIDGSEEASDANTTDNNSNTGIGPCVAIRDGANEPYGGIIDNASIANEYESDAWTKADYHAQTDNLLTFGATQLAPTHEILGTVSEDGTYVSRTVRLHKRSDGLLVDEVVSSSVDGTFSFSLFDGTTEYYVVALDDTSDATDYNALIYDRVTGVAI